MVLFDSRSENVIMQFMLDNPNHSSPFAVLSRMIPYSNKQISHHWNNKLNPLLNHDDLVDNEKVFIYNWGVQTEGGTISWKHCQQEMRTRFGKLFSTNKIKNTWYSEQKKRPACEVGNSAQFIVPSSSSSMNNDTGTFIVLPSLNDESIAPYSMSINNEFGGSRRINVLSLLNDNDDSIPPLIIEPRFRPDLTEYDRRCLLELTCGYRHQ
ncbi:hypothetical protein C1645_822037 [Glomus cerebriforme]|uniref:HTH myb-type domain-containing protein n=1 Tax=Glomus cerebriforme TaxID=658196 RepID=A0A397T3I2_9GLOM|nr:hypothetical protein C1645_822037 [Glomus cerebriforme]